MPTVPPVPDSDSPAPNEVCSNSEDTTLHFDYPNPDIVLRSCDSHTFPVPKLYIANSSPILQELIRNIPNTSDVVNGENQESLPVVQLPESGATIYRLLTFVFPFVPTVPSTSEEIMELLAAAQKYQMDSVLSHIRGITARQNPPFIRPETALHIYFLAQKYELLQEALEAARVTLRLPMVIEELGDKLNSPCMTGACLYELWKYHKRVRSDLRSGVREFRDSGLPEDVKGLRCKNPHGYRDTDNFPLWLDNYIDSIAEAPHLLDFIEFENAWTRHLKESETNSQRTCSCLEIPGQLRRAFWEALTAFVHGTIEGADSALALVREEPTSENSDPPPEPLDLDIPEANFILRSSDQLNFRVHKSLLRMSSPFFKDLLSLPQPPSDELVDGLPVVQLPENASLLNSLISLLYPTHRIQPASYKEVYALLNACQKYDMVLIQSFIRDEVRLERFPAPVQSQAAIAYAIACSMGLRPEMEHAARLTLGQPLTFESLGAGLRSFNGQSLCDLIRYRVANNSNSSSRASKRGHKNR